ncbi:hypothetical protein BN903_170 [Halorubrum sp. AJ67]|nr:hypothetical protein BN903_170 [Halorubrum sp. AJ67]
MDRRLLKPGQRVLGRRARRSEVPGGSEERGVPNRSSEVL